jgi:hypothetical protein
VLDPGHGLVSVARLRGQGGGADMAKNSLVGNINKRRKLGISRPKSASTVSAKSYAAMKRGWKKSK